MRAARWLGIAAGVVIVGALVLNWSGGSLYSFVRPQAVPASDPAAQEPHAYPRCPSKGRLNGKACYDLHTVDIGESTVEDFPLAGIPLSDGRHTATASGLAGANIYFSSIISMPSGQLYAVGGPRLSIASASGEDATTWRVAKLTRFSNALRGIAFTDAQQGYAVGKNGILFRTRDGGEHWDAFNRMFEDAHDPQRTDLHFPGEAYSVAFADARHGVIVGEDRILRTSDGGEQWQRVPQMLDNRALQQVQFVDSHRGWAVGSSGTVLRTDNTGATWTAVPLGDDDVHLMGLSFSDPEHGCIGGGLKVWCSQDAGQHWQAAKLPMPAGTYSGDAVTITQVRMRDAQHGWLITRHGLIYSTQDGGHRWTLWMDVAKAAHGELDGIELWSLALGHERVWAVGVGDFAAPQDAAADGNSVSLSSSPLMVSWPM